MGTWYREDLAYVHDVGHGDFAWQAAPGILALLLRNNISAGLVVDLGCGSGLWARELSRAGYQCRGIDISEAMIAMAPRRVPVAEFRVASLFKTKLPRCSAVTSLGECLNYIFDPANNSNTLARLFRRIHQALLPGGVFIFDIAEPGQVPPGVISRSFRAASDWLVTVEKTENRKQSVLTRRINTFRKIGNCYRRVEEVHRQRLYRSADIARALRNEGFKVRTSRHYGKYRLPEAHAAFIARKPGEA